MPRFGVSDAPSHLVGPRLAADEAESGTLPVPSVDAPLQANRHLDRRLRPAALSGRTHPRARHV